MLEDRFRPPQTTSNAPVPSIVEVEPADAEYRALELRSMVREALSSVLEPLDIKYKFAIQPRRDRDRSSTTDPAATKLQIEPQYRISVLCIAKTSLQCDLISVPLAQALRNLDLAECSEAIVKFTRRGDAAPQWRLRIDLTPAAVMLQDWARWGDVQAITQAINLALAGERIQVNTVLKNLTLHIHCFLAPTADKEMKFPRKQVVLERIASLLERMQPQGIQAAKLYGMQSNPDRFGQIIDSTIWTHWLDLAAARDLDFTPTPLHLASQGEPAALSFIIQRFLNPDLEAYLNGGAISIAIVQRGGLLHVMSEAIVCPLQSQVASPTVKVLRQLALPGVAGVRIYGRIVGQKALQWSYGMDFEPEQNALPSQVQENAASRVGIPPSPPPSDRQQWLDRAAAKLTATPFWQPQTASLIPIPPTKKVIAFALAGCAMVGAIDRLMPHALGVKEVPTQISNLEGEINRLDFNNSLLVQKIQQYQQLCRTQGAPDVLIVGSSRALRGVDPEILRQELSGRGYPAVTVYNFGINGATAQVVDTILRQLLTPKELPKLVIWVDGARAFNSGRNDRTFESIALSRSYRQIVNNRDENKPLTQVQTSVKNSAQAIDTAVDRSLANLSASHAHRDRLKAWLQAHTPRFKLDRLADNNSASAVADLPQSIQDSDVNEMGFLPLELKFDPNTYYRQYLKVSGNSDGDYASFQLTGMQADATLKTIELLSGKNIPLVFINAPLSDLYLDRYRRDRDAEFTTYMKSLADDRQITFLNLASIWEKQHEFFSDPSHLNRFGAIDLTRQIANTDLIPWTQIQRSQKSELR